MYYGGNKNFPICNLRTCESAFEDEINAAMQEAAQEAVEGVEVYVQGNESA